MSEESREPTRDDDHLLLAKLLERQRSPELKQAVDEILERSLPVKEKADLIAALDRKASESHYLSAGRRDREDGQGSGEALDDGAAAASVEELLAAEHKDPTWQRELRRRRSEIKRRVEPVGFIGFLFFDAPRIRKFNRRAHALRLGLLPGRMRVDPARVSELKQKLVPAARTLAASLDGVLALGWKHLGKRDYNLLVLLHRMCHALGQVKLDRLDSKQRRGVDGHALVRTLRSVETSFLVLRNEDEDAIRLDRAIRLYADQSQDEDFDRQGAVRHLYLLLGKPSAGGRLEDILVAANIVYHRRYLGIEDLYDRTAESLISADQYECSSEVRARIRAYLAELIRQLPGYVNALREIQRMHLFVPQDGEGKTDYSTLVSFYNRASRDFETDRQNVLVLAQRLAQTFLRDFEPLLDGQVHLQGRGRIRIFTSDFFHEELSRLKLLVGRLEELSYSFPTFPESRYTQLKRAKQGATDAESSVMDAIDETYFQIAAIGKKLMNLLARRSNSADETAAVELPLEQGVLQRTAFLCEALNLQVDEDSPLLQGTLVETIQNVVQVALLAAAFFEESTTVAALKRESHLQGEIERRLNRIRSVATPETVASVRELYSI
jgi:hypothetical protein